MIVHRHIWNVKHECRDEFIELTKAALGEQVTLRVCSFIFGPYDTVLVDTEFETLEEEQKFSWDWSKPKLAEWGKKHHDLIVSGPINELLRVH
jgi:hypothetical protein